MWAFHYCVSVAGARGDIQVVLGSGRAWRSRGANQRQKWRGCSGLEFLIIVIHNLQFVWQMFPQRQMKYRIWTKSLCTAPGRISCVVPQKGSRLVSSLPGCVCASSLSEQTGIVMGSGLQAGVGQKRASLPWAEHAGTVQNLSQWKVALLQEFLF